MSGPARSVTIVTQTCVQPDRADDFVRWQAGTSAFIDKVPGFIEQTIVPPSPPLQVDWVIVQRFESMQAAQQWLNSPERAKRLEEVLPMLVGRDDVHIVQDDAAGMRPAPVSAVISTRVKPGTEAAYRAWERRIAAAQTRAPGFQGYRFEPPVPGVQDDHVAILRFDSEANLQAWLDSPERKKLVDEAAPLTEEYHARIVRTGFQQWFRDEAAPDAAPLPAWKMNMLVLLVLYPVVFLWGVFIGGPLLSNRLGMSFAIALFVGNVVSVVLTGYLVPWTANRFDWWLRPGGKNLLRIHVAGAALVTALYAIMVVAFWRLF